MTELTTTFEHLLVRRGPGHVTTPTDRLDLIMHGIRNQHGEKHYGQTAPAGVCDVGFRRDGPYRSEIFNHRQVSVIDLASLTAIADGMEIDGDVTEDYFDQSRELFVASRIGANVVTGVLSDGRGLHDIEPVYHIGPLDYVGLFAATVMVISYNEPCTRPGKSIAEVYPGAPEGMGKRFVEVARSIRGFVGVVGCAGTFAVGEQARISMLPKVPREETN